MKKVLFSLMTILLFLSLAGCKTEKEELINGYYGPKSPEIEKEAGDIVFKDGSALPFTPGITLSKTQKKYAIAVIFYKGTGLNSGNDTTTVRTLGVGLKHTTDRIAWCTSDADALDVFIDTTICDRTGAMADYTFNGDKNGSDNLEQMENKDGIDDTQDPEKYPAFYFAKKYSETETKLKGTPYENGWYLPTNAEYSRIYLAMHDGIGIYGTKYVDIDYISGLCGGSKFSETDSSFWTSNQAFPSGPTGNKTAKAVTLAGSSHCSDVILQKDNDSSAKACAIREF